MEGCNHWVGGGQPRGINPSVAFPILWKADAESLNGNHGTNSRETWAGAQAIDWLLRHGSRGDLPT
jgi:hypothetical protein